MGCGTASPAAAGRELNGAAETLTGGALGGRTPGGPWKSVSGERETRPGRGRTVAATIAQSRASITLRGSVFMSRAIKGGQPIEMQNVAHAPRLQTRGLASSEIKIRPRLTLDGASNIEHDG